MADPEQKEVRVTNNRMTDTLEFASELQEELNKKGLAHVREALAPQHHPDFDGESCVACGNDMPPERLAAHRVRCTPCESALERHHKVYGGRK